MKEKKNIDHLFKEQLSNFEATPSPAVWEHIQSAINEEKKERKVIPLWWKFAGVAALIALLFTIGTAIFDTPSKTSDIVTEDTQEIKTNTDALKTEDTNNTITSSENTVIASQDETETLEDTSNTSENNTKANSNNDAIYKKASASKDAIAVEDLTTKKVQKNSDKKEFLKNTPNTSNKEVIAVTTPENKNTTTAEKTTTNAIDKNKKLSSKTVVAVEENNPTTSKVNSASETNTKKSIYDAIEEAKTQEAVANVKSKPDNRWDVAPNFAPVYYNSLSEGSSIDPSFADNSQSGDVNFSYGVAVSYAITDRLSVRSGVNNVDVSYATGGVELGTGPVSQALGSVDYGTRQTVLTAFDKGTLMAANVDPNNPFSTITPKSTSGDVSLVQNINYFEVPLELKYAVLNNKFGVNLIGGFSTLLLGNNDITAQATNFSETLGEANNLASVSFSTNVGIGFDYKISKKFKFNIEPMFKYQLNPYTDSSVNFRPYYLGVYTGLSFKF